MAASKGRRKRGRKAPPEQPEIPDLESALRMVGVPDEAFAQVDRSVIAWEVCDEVFKDCAEPEGVLLLCVSPAWASKYPNALYRAHIHEQMCRVRDGEDLLSVTRAEALLCFSQLSLQAPMNRQFADSYIALFNEIGLTFPQGGRPEPAREPYPGAYNETIEFVRSKMTPPERGAVGEAEREYMAKLKGARKKTRKTSRKKKK